LKGTDAMEERSLRIYQEKTFFSKISNTITKILTPTKIGINGIQKKLELVTNYHIINSEMNTWHMI
jgi:hypothetical protein